MGKARILVSHELLREALHLPAGTDIRVVRTVDYDTCEMVVEHHDLKDVVIEPGEQPPLVTPTFRTQQAVSFEGWNQQ